MSTELQVIERAEKALSFTTRKDELAELAKQSERITEITNTAGYQECHAARMTLKNARVDIQKAGKDARDDATKFSKAVIAKEKELIDMIQPEENRLQSIQGEWDEAREKERQAKERAERQRIADLQARVGQFHAQASEMTGHSALVIAGRIAKLQETVIGEDFQEFAAEAESAKATAISALQQLHAAQVEHEAEQDRIKAERAELERLRAEQAKRLAEEEAAAAKARAEADRAAREQREKDAAEQRAKDEADRAARAEQEAEQRKIDDAARAEREREAAAERKRQQEEANRLQREREQLERDRAEEARKKLERELAEVTLEGAANDAYQLLLAESYGDHIVTLKLAAALGADHKQQVAA